MENFKAQVITFLQNSEQLKNALSPLKNSAVIAIHIEDQIHLKVRSLNKGIDVSESSSLQPDLSFYFNFESARHLIVQTELDKTDFAIEVLKQASLGNVSLKVHRSVLKLMRLGFIKAVTSVGAPFWTHLSHYGISSLSKLNQFLTKLRAD